MGLQETDPYANYIHSVSGAQAQPTQLTGRSNLEQEIGDFSKLRRFKEMKSNGLTFDLTNYFVHVSI